MSEHDEPGLDELERQLDAAFATTRPRRGFEDELWARLGARSRPPRRSAGFPWVAVWAAAGGLAAVLVVVLGTIGLAMLALVAVHPHGGAGESRTTSGAAQPALAGPGFGRLPAPAAAGAPQVVRGGSLLALPAGGARMEFVGVSLPRTASTLPVYSYDAAPGPRDGAVFDPGAVPPGGSIAYYPTQQPGEALVAAAAREVGPSPSAKQPDVALTQERLVYVAVVSGGRAYLEPAYLFTGTARVGGGTVAAQVLVPALAASALQ
jgi:hypothetical protein